MKAWPGVLAAALALALGVAAAWPIYRTPWLFLVAAAALVLGAGIALAARRWRFSFPVVAGLLLVVFALTVVPVAVPSAITRPLRGLADGLAAVALGWKQLLTLDLPVGSYQTVLVPVYAVLLLSAVLIVLLAQRGGRVAPLAAVPMLAPVAFGTVFGASAVSDPLGIGPFALVAPREIGLWLAAAVLAGGWVAWVSGADRRAALRRGRPGEERRPGGLLRAAAAAGVLVVALAAGLLLAPAIDSELREVPRDGVDPELVVRETPSPLAAYRSAKLDEALDAPLFTVSATDEAPERLRLAALDAYNGVDFHVSEDAAGRFTRFPSGEPLERPTSVTVEIQEGYSGIWVPTAELGAPPRFSGSRAAALADGFYVNRESLTAIAAPRGDVQGLLPGDGYTVDMETAPAPDALGDPPVDDPRFDLKSMPQLSAWMAEQNTDDVTELIDRLRARGYLSHSIEQGAWLDRLSEAYGASFEPSAGGHSIARLETLFEQLNEQEAAAGEDADSAELVAGVGDDEQFAAAAAIIARALGYESRVVVGVRLEAGVPGVPACDDECTGEHLAAWIEVRGTDGWVPFDVTPQVQNAPQRLDEGERLPEFGTDTEERDAREVDPPIGLRDQSESDPGETEAEAAPWLLPLLRSVGLGAGAALLIVIPFAFLPLAKRLRARRRRRASLPEVSALGAWEEVLDRARDRGIRIPEGASRVEIAEELDSDDALRIADDVDRAVYSEGGIEASEGAAIWRSVDAVEFSDGREGRLRAAYSLRSYFAPGLERFMRMRRLTLLAYAAVILLSTAGLWMIARILFA